MHPLAVMGVIAAVAVGVMMVSMGGTGSTSASRVSTITCTMGGRPVPSDRVDDGFCDCPDTGADEPNTAACSAAQQSRRTFSCGANDEMAYLSRVCDGVCDCCNGADEKLSSASCPSKVVCPNTCATKKAKQQEARKATAATRQQELTLRAAYVAKGKTAYDQHMADSDMSQLHANFNQTAEALKEMKRQAEVENVTMTPELWERVQALRVKGGGLRDQIQKIKSWASAIGKEQQFGTLLGRCWNLTRHEKIFRGGSAEPKQFNVTFELCPFDRVTQHTHDDEGRAPVVLGHWVQWTDRTFTALPGTDGNPLRSQLYANGEPCWQGPDRVAAVHVQCGTEDTLTDVFENGKCNYELRFTTPGACL